MKIFNLSLNRSATNSLHEALGILGFKSLHSVTISNIRPWRAKNKPLLQDEIKAHDALSAGLGWFGADIMKELLKNYPDAHYIIARRELGAWLDSWERNKITTAASSMIAGSAYRPMIKTSGLMDIWHRHRAFLDGLPIKNLLDVATEELNWKTLAPFLGKPVPDQPYPRVNVSSGQLQKLTDTLNDTRWVHIIQPPKPKPVRPTRAFRHLVLTRYNLRLYNTTERAPIAGKTTMTPEGWMWHRYWLFREFCVPSILRQTNQDFEWLVFVDPKTPKRQLKHIDAILPDNARTIKVPHPTEIADKIAELRIPKYTLTTMLDNDDMLREDTIESIQILARRIIRRRKPPIHYIDIPGGYTVDENLAEFYECDLVNVKRSRRTSFVSYLNDESSKLHALRFGPLCATSPERPSFLHERLWTRVIHGGNISNQLTGSRCATPTGFGIGIKIKLPVEFPGI